MKPPARSPDRETLMALVETSRAIGAETELAAIFERIAERAMVVLRGEAASVLLLDADGRELVFVCAAGRASEKLAGVAFDAGRGLAGQALQTRRAVRADAAQESEHFYAGIDELTNIETRSLLAAPLIHRNRAIGVVEVINPVGREAFDEGDIEVLEVFAALTAPPAAQAQALDRARRQNDALRTAAPPTAMLGDSVPLRQALELCRRVAPTTTTVLLLGETGTGKELAAREIHNASARRGEPFVAINCAALPEQLLESELFGRERGAFTGAVTSAPGRFELAAGGTLFLDEVGEMSPAIQAKLLRVVQEREFVRVGGTRTQRADVRLIAATNRDLKQAVADGRFREDLYYRLGVFPIELPPLRQRTGDVPRLARRFLDELAPSLGMASAPPVLGEPALACLGAHRWPGNIRELRNVIERAALLAGPGGTIQPEHLPPEIPRADGAAAPAAVASRLDDQERALIARALEAHDWNCSAAARELGISRDVLRYRMKKYDLKSPQRAG
jgi:Nif-specific regulatory protein